MTTAIDFLRRQGEKKSGQKHPSITQYTYFNIMLVRLRQVIKQKRLGEQFLKIFAIRNDTCSHSTRLRCSFLEDFGWDVFDHAAYSPDFTRSDFHTFPGLYDFLGG